MGGCWHSVRVGFGFWLWRLGSHATPRGVHLTYLSQSEYVQISSRRPLDLRWRNLDVHRHDQIYANLTMKGNAVSPGTFTTLVMLQQCSVCLRSDVRHLATIGRRR